MIAKNQIKDDEDVQTANDEWVEYLLMSLKSVESIA
jgi:hypothetical protein